MILSSSCFLLPIFFLPLIPNIQNSLLFLFLMSSFYHYKGNLLSRVLDNIAIINMTTMSYFNNFHFSIYYIFLYLLENRFWKTRMTVYFLYGLNLYENLQYNDNRIFLWFSISFLIYMNTFRRMNIKFLNYERWLWHFGQTMYIYHSLKFKDKLLLE